MESNLKFVMERLRNLYNDITLSDNEYIEKKNAECGIKFDKDNMYAIKAGEMKGTIETLLYLFDK